MKQANKIAAGFTFKSLKLEWKAVNVGFIILWPEQAKKKDISDSDAKGWNLCMLFYICYYFILILYLPDLNLVLSFLWVTGDLFFLTVAWNVFCDNFAFIHVQIAEHVFASSLLNAGQDMWRLHSAIILLWGLLKVTVWFSSVFFVSWLLKKTFLWSDMMLVEAQSWSFSCFLVFVFKKFYYHMLEVRQSSAASTKA